MKHSPRAWVVLTLVGLLSFTLQAQSVFSSHEGERRSRTFHVVHYRLELGFDMAAGEVYGTTGITFTPLSGPLDSVVLDAVDMNIRSVRLAGGPPLGFHARSTELGVLLNRRYAVGETLTVAVQYSCTPAKGLFFIHADSGSTERHDQIWSQGEDTDNRYWFPCYDYPNDKATSEVIATVPDSFSLVSNGRLVKETHDTSRRTRTFHWKQEKPHSSYLIMVAAGKYAIAKAKYRNIPLLYYVPPEDTANISWTFAKTPSMMRFFEELTGVPYPWEKYAQIVIDDFMWGGMENTSAVTLNTATVVDSCASLDFPSDGVVAHELAHMWWGDLVTPRDWTDLWLNEGFATYFEALYTEATLGENEFQYEMILASAASRNADRLQGRKPVVSEESYLVNVYSRGAWVLHMLRDVLGDEAFQRGLRYYLKKYQYGNAETREFKLALEDATGQNLDWFFDQWLYGAGYPRLKAATTWDSSAHMLQITVRQTQETDSLTGIFRFPLNVECTTASDKTTKRFWVERDSQTFSVPLERRPLMVILDKGYHVLKELTFPKSGEEYRYQLRHANDVADRITAARGLGDLGEDAMNRAELAAAAREDPFWGVREAALVALGEWPPDSVRDIMLQASHDPRSRVRYAAAYQLSPYHDVEIRHRLEEMARTDCSYLVASGALRNLASIDTVRAFEVARDLISRESYRNLVRHAALEVLRETRNPRALAVALPYTSPRYDDATRKEALGVLGELGADSATARAALRRTLNDRLPGIRSSSVQAVAGWNDPEFIDILRAMASKEKDKEVLDALRKADATPQD